MEVFIARQPILTGNNKVYGYELLFRSGPENAFGDHDPDRASSQVLSTSSALFDPTTLTAGHPAFINFSRQLLLEGSAQLLPPDQIVIEVLEDVAPEPDIVRAVQDLKEKGYRIALDDVVDPEDFGPLVELADYIKVDWLAAGAAGARRVIRELSRPGLTFLAEKLESWADFQVARDLGFRLFQGYYFQKPEMMTRGDIPRNRQIALALLMEASKDPLDFPRVESLIKQDMSLTYRLLRMVNSAWAGLPREIVSINHAIVMLGEIQVRRLIEVSAMAGLGEDKVEELVRLSFIRAHFLEGLAAEVPGLSVIQDQELYFVGLFSWLDVLLGAEMAKILEYLPLSNAARAALIRREGRLGELLQLCEAMEAGDWIQSDARCVELGIEPAHAAELRIDSISRAVQSEMEQAIGPRP